MHYCNISLEKNINEILQYFNKNNDIALIMHQRALIQGSDIFSVRGFLPSLRIKRLFVRGSAKGSFCSRQIEFSQICDPNTASKNKGLKIPVYHIYIEIKLKPSSISMTLAICRNSMKIKFCFRTVSPKHNNQCSSIVEVMVFQGKRLCVFRRNNQNRNRNCWNRKWEPKMRTENGSRKWEPKMRTENGNQ